MSIAKDSSLKQISRAFRSIIPVQVRRRTDYQVVTSLTASAITTGGTYTYGQGIDVSDYNELFLEILGTSLVLGSGAGLQARLEVLSIKDSVWYPYPAVSGSSFPANPTSALSPAAGTSVIAAYNIPPHFGGMVRVGLTCTTTFTSGQISAALTMKG